MTTTTGKGSLFRSLIIALGIICIGIAAYSIVEVNRQAKNDQTNIQSIANLRIKALRITKLADDAGAAREEAFDSLTGLTTEMERGWKTLQQRLKKQGEISPTQIKFVADSWGKVQEELNQLADSRETVIFVSTVARKLNETYPRYRITPVRL